MDKGILTQRIKYVYGGSSTSINLQIVEQTYIGTKFGIKGDWTASNGIILCSCQVPEWTGNSLYVWGKEKSRNNDILTISGERKAKLVISALREFNKVFDLDHCKHTCGVILCEECMKNIRDNLMFSFSEVSGV